MPLYIAGSAASSCASKALIAVALQLFHHALLALRGKLCMLHGVVGVGRVRHARQQRTFVWRHLGGLLTKIAAARLPDIPVAAAKIDAVHIQLQNLVFCIARLQFPRHKQLGHLARQLFCLGKIQVFCQLLRDGAAALNIGPGAQIVPKRAADGDHIDAAVRVKPVILHGHHGVQIQRRQPVQRGKPRLGAQFGHCLGQRLFGQRILIHLISPQQNDRGRNRAHREQKCYCPHHDMPQSLPQPFHIPSPFLSLSPKAARRARCAVLPGAARPCALRCAGRNALLPGAARPCARGAPAGTLCCPALHGPVPCGAPAGTL